MPRARPTDRNVNLAARELDLHLARAAGTLDELIVPPVVLRRELQKRREEVLAVPADTEGRGEGVGRGGHCVVGGGEEGCDDARQCG